MEITKEMLNELEVEVFEGDIIVVDSSKQIEEACKKLIENEIIGFDTETKPAFRKGVINKVALLQLSTLDTCYLFRLNKISMPQPLIDILADETIKKIGLSLRDDFNALGKRYSFRPSNFVEIQNMVKPFGIEEQSLQRIYAVLFSKRITKGQRLSNWEADQLTEAQQMYAAIDAWACLKIYNKLAT